MNYAQLPAVAGLFLSLAGCSGGSSFTAPSDTNSTGGQAAAGGADNQGGDQSVGGASSTPNSSADGYSGLNCDQLASTYTTELALARQCPATAMDQCTTLVAASIPCGCHTFVNTARTSQITHLEQLSAAYTLAACPACTSTTDCASPTSASCSTSGSGSAARCADDVAGAN